MKIASYVGIDESVITIQRPQDLYPLLDWFQSQLMDLGASADSVKYVEELLQKVQADGFGSYDDVEDIEYS